MAEVEFAVSGQTYRTTKMNTFVQFHLARRVAPLMIPIAAQLGEGGDLRQVLAAGGGEPMMQFAVPIIEAIGTMSDTDAENIIFPCLAVVQRQSGPAWSNVLAGGGLGSHAMMFDDITLPDMLQLVWKVLEVNLQAFFHAVPSTSGGPAAAPTTTP